MSRVITVRWRHSLILNLFVSPILLPPGTPFHQMHSKPDIASPEDIAISLLATQGLELQTFRLLQSLWAGYGSIYQITASPSLLPNLLKQKSSPATILGPTILQEAQSSILKLITPPTNTEDEGHTRKILSYQVEQYFYTHLAPSMPRTIPVAECYASINKYNPNRTLTTAMILTDLRQTFPVAGEKREFLGCTQVHSALNWLSSFHGFWWSRIESFDRTSMVRPPLEESVRTHTNMGKKSVWLNGGYTYLATRRKEFRVLAMNYDSEWNKPLTGLVGHDVSLSDMVAAVLAPRVDGRGSTEDYQTLIHGDVKSENLFTSASGDDVAFYDFQYTGLGLGVCDLAKFFTCSVPLHMFTESLNMPIELEMQQGEKRLLEEYLIALTEASGKIYDWDVFVRHWETALVDWLRFQAGWGFWGNTGWLQARVRSILKDDGWRQTVIEYGTF